MNSLAPNPSAPVVVLEAPVAHRREGTRVIVVRR